MVLVVEKPKAVSWKPIFWRLTLTFFIFLLLAAGFLIYAKIQNIYLPAYKIINYFGEGGLLHPNAKTGRPIERGLELHNFERVWVSPYSQADIAAGENVFVRMKGDSEIEIRKPGLSLLGWAAYRLHVRRGQVFIMVTSPKSLQISVPHSVKIEKVGDAYVQIWKPLFVAALKKGAYLVDVNHEEKSATLSVLRGKASVRRGTLGQKIQLGVHEKLLVDLENVDAEPMRLEMKDWSNLEEIYAMDFKSTPGVGQSEAVRYFPGNLGGKVKEIGTRSEQGDGYVTYRFVSPVTQDQANSVLKLTYEVMNEGDAASFYIQTKNLDLSQYESLELLMALELSDNPPERFVVELKSGGRTVRNFLIRDLSRGSSIKSFPLQVTSPIMLSEIVIRFRNSLAGSSKVGSVRFNEINLIPKK
ncbi:MAG: hypothetical protein JW893_01010 [Candidatus Omnitrophica bacterium]|nr:hypothetical protein [Candidatus Omnitrophota bacterium]